MKAITLTHKYIVCPYCAKKEWIVDHLIGRSPLHAGPWFCDQCGQSFTLIGQPDGTIDITLRTERRIATWDLLMLPPQAKPVYFVVPGAQYPDWTTGQSEEFERKRYFYEEHSCPTNWLEPELIACDGDRDPHGLIQFVRFVVATDVPESDYPQRQTWEWVSTFPELRGPHDEDEGEG